MFVDMTTHEFVCRIVYFGPGLSGKSSNLRALREHLAGFQVSDPQAIDTQGERILRCEIRGGDLPGLAGLACRIEVLTNPGRSYYNANRRDILEGADGIVFVADSRREAIDENIDAMNDLWSFLNHHRIGSDIPLIIQFNKQDLDSAIPFEQLDPLLNSQQKPSFAAVADQGRGVVETFQAVRTAVLAEIDEDRVRQEIEHTGGKPVSTPDRSPGTESKPASEDGWLLTCWRCDAVLEVAAARPGDLFTCGSCNSVLEVADPDTGVTKPGRTPDPVPATRQPSPLPTDEYQTLPEPSGQESALQSQSLGGHAPPPPTTDFSWQDPQSQSIARDISGQQPTLSGQVDLVPRIDGYEFGEQIDSSLIGTRFRAIERERSRTLRALALNPMLLRQPGYSDNLEPHLRLAGQVRHPNLVPVVAVRWWNHVPVIFSVDTPEYEPLSLILSRRRTLAPPQAMGITRQLALALEESARRGVVHGWIRPEVVLINPAGSVLLDDLVVPKNPGFLVRESMGGSASTEYYLAPEQLHGEATPDSRTDIFLLGCLLFRMVTGEGLITGYNAHEALHKLSTNGPRRMREVNAEISRDLDSFFLRLVAVERKDRLQKHQELLQALEKFGGGAKRNTMRAARHPHTARVTHQRTTVGTGSGSAAGRTRRVGPRRSLGATTSYQEEVEEQPHRHARRRSRSLPVLILLLLVAVVVLIALNHESIDLGGGVFGTRSQPSRPRSTADRGVDRGGDARPQVPADPAPAPVVPPAPEDPLLLARHLLRELEAGQSDATQENRLVAVLAELRRHRDPAVQREGWDLTNRLNALRERQSRGGEQRPTPSEDRPSAGDATTPETPETPEADTDPAMAGDETVPARVKLAVNELLAAERFGEALAMVESEIAEDGQRAFFRELITERHRAARSGIARLVRAERDIEQVLVHLEPAFRHWGMEGDAEWASGLLMESRQRLQDTPPPDDAVEDDATSPVPAVPAEGIATIDGQALSILVADRAIDQALITNDLAAARRVLAGVADASAATSLAAKIDLFAAGPEVMGAAFAERTPTARVKTPFAGQRWNVAAIQEDGIQVVSPADERTLLTWSQLDLADVGQVYDRIAAGRTDEADPREDAIACVTLLVGNNPGLASVAASRARRARYEGYELLSEMIANNRRHRAAELVVRAERAIRAGDGPTLAEVVTTLEEDDRIAFAERDVAIARYRRLVDRGVVGESRPGTASEDGGDPGDDTVDRDRLSFAAEADLMAFPMRTGPWEVRDGALRAGRGTSSLVRRDMRHAESLAVEMTVGGATGQFTIDFRGTTFTFDFERAGFSARNEAASADFVAFPVIPELPYKIDIEQRSDSVVIEVNNTESIRLALGPVSDQLRISAQQCTDLAMTALTIKRSPAAQQATRPPGAEVLEQALGWSPLGRVELRAPQILLSPPEVGHSAIVRALDATTVGVRFEVQGGPAMRIQLGDREGRLHTVSLPLPENDAVLRVTVRWDGEGMTVEAAGESETQQEHIAVPPTTPRRHLVLQAERSLTFLAPPRTIRADE